MRRHLSSTTGRRADVWSVGCTVIEMLTGRPPWAASGAVDLGNQWAALYAIASSREGPPRPEGLSAAAASFLDACLQVRLRVCSFACVCVGEEEGVALLLLLSLLLLPRRAPLLWSCRVCAF